MAHSGSTRPCFSVDDGLVSISRTGCNSAAASTVVPRRRGSLRSLASLCSSPRSGPGRVFDARYEESPPHFLEACSLCKKPLGANRDIFMYRGDMPFCSEECREEQIEIDNATEKSRSLSASMNAMRSKHQLDSSQHNSGKSQKYTFRWIAAA